MTFHYCPQCGAKLILKPIGDEGPTPFCPACMRPFFSYSHPCVLCLAISEEGEIALIRQSYVSEHYVCVAGYVKQGETLECAAKREVEEEIGLTVLSAYYISSYSYEKRDNLMLGFVCRVNKAAFNLSSEVERAEWFSLEQAGALLRPGSVAKSLLDDNLSCASASNMDP